MAPALLWASARVDADFLREARPPSTESPHGDARKDLSMPLTLVPPSPAVDSDCAASSSSAVSDHPATGATRELERAGLMRAIPVAKRTLARFHGMGPWPFEKGTPPFGTRPPSIQNGPPSIEIGPLRIESGPVSMEAGPRSIRTGPFPFGAGPPLFGGGGGRMEEGPARREHGPLRIERGAARMQEGPSPMD